MKILEAELKNVAFTYAFAKLFNVRVAKGEDKATVEVTELREACQEWIDLTSAQPKRIEDAESAIKQAMRRKTTKSEQRLICVSSSA